MAALPSPLDDLFVKSNMELLYIDLLCKCESIMIAIRLPVFRLKNVGLCTREQSLPKV